MKVNNKKRVESQIKTMKENQGWSDGGFSVAGVSIEKYKVKVPVSDRHKQLTQRRDSVIVTMSVLMQLPSRRRKGSMASGNSKCVT